MNNVSLINPIYLNWSLPNRGFGQLYLYQSGNVVFCDNELLDKETIKQILNKLVDDCVLTCEKTLEDKWQLT